MTTTMAEPEWDQTTRDAALGLAVYAESLCPLCHRPTYICQDPALQHSWAAPDPVRCHATTALLQKQSVYTEESNPQSGALLFGIDLIEEADGG